MFAALIVVHVLVSVVLVLVVLIQTGRGAELGAAFGGMGQATYARGQTTFLAKFTTGLAVVFMCTSLTLAFLSTEQPTGSILSSDMAASPAAHQEAPAATPPAPAETNKKAAAEPAPQAPPLEQKDAPSKPANTH